MKRGLNENGAGRIGYRAWAVAVLAGGLTAAQAAGAPAEDARRLVTDAASGALSMHVGQTLCWTYVPQGREGKPYFHPLALPGTGEALTAYRPPDHAWHLGLWFSWKLINGYNFWEPTSNAVTRVVAQRITPEPDKRVTIEVTLAYLGDGLELVRETRTVRVTTAFNGNYAIAWESAFTAQDRPVEFACTPAKRGKDGNWATGGYAGLMWRFPDADSLTCRYVNAEGKSDVQTCGESSERLDITAVSVATGARARIVIRDRGGHPRQPTPWFARHDLKAHKGRGYFLAGPSLIFHEPLRLAAGATLTVRYAVEVERMP